MKIALFCPTVSGRGGMESAIRNLISGFQSIGDECRLVLMGGSFDKQWLTGLPSTRIADTTTPRWLRLLSYATGPSVFLLRWKPDVIIASDMTTLRMALLARKVTGKKNLRIGSWIHFPVRILRMKEYLALADFHLAISDDIAGDIRASVPPEKSATIHTIYNGVPVGLHPLVKRPSRITFLYVGRLTWDGQKRVNDILEALARLRGDFCVKIVGAASPQRPEEGEKLLALAERSGLSSRIQWLGWQADPWSDVEATALVMSSAHEGFPMTLVEAISRGLPCVSSNCKSGPSEIIEEGKNGWLYPVGDVDRLAAILQSIIDSPAILPSAATVLETADRFSDTATARRARQAVDQAMRSSKLPQ